MTSDIHRKFSIIVPVYNGLPYLENFLEAVPVQLRRHLIFIDDGSTDGTSAWLEGRELAYFRHGQNRGKGAAISTGIDVARSAESEFVITMDVDLQHATGMLESFLSPEGDDFYCGYRFPRKNMPLQRKLSNFITSMLLTVRCNTVIFDSQCGYRRIPISFFDRTIVHESGFQMESEILVKASLLGYRIRHIKIPTIYTGSPSAIRPVRDTIKFIELWLRSYLWN